MNPIFKRVSVRSFQDRAVEAEKIELLLRAGFAAPSAVNQQPWEFYVVTNKTTLQELSECSPYAICTKNAPMAIVPCYRTVDLTSPMHAEIDMGACCENILLEAVALDLGAVWLGVAPVTERMELVSRILQLPQGLTPFSILPCGYALRERPQKDRYDPARVHHIG